MPSVIQRSFAGGEIAPALGARADQVRYQTGLRTCRNFQVMRHGGAQNRAGTQFLAEVKDSTDRTYLGKFVFNADQSYVLEFGGEYIRFYRQAARIVVSGVSAWSNATAYVVGDLAVEGGVNYYCILAHTNQQPPNATYWYPLTGTIYEIPAPYAAADLAALRFVQSADVLTIFHQDYDPMELRRYGHTNWTLAPVTFEQSIAAPENLAVDNTGTDVYYVVTAIDDETGEESPASDPVGATGDPDNPNTLTWDAVTGASNYRVYRSWNGLYALVGFAGAGLSFYDPGITPDTAVQPPVTADAFDEESDRPGQAAYFQQRLMLASSENNPETVWGSRTGLPRNFTKSRPSRPDDAVKFQLSQGTVESVRALLEFKGLFIFCGNSVWRLGGIEGKEALTPTNIGPKRESLVGISEAVPPVIAGDTVLFVQARGGQLRDLLFDWTADGYQGKDLSIFSPHLVDGHSIERMDFQTIPHPIAWMVRSDGTLLGLTYLREHQIAGWHRHDTDGVIEDVCVIPEGNEDVVYLAVKRTIDGNTVRYIERMASRVIDADDGSTWNFLDSFLTFDGRNTGATTITGHFPIAPDPEGTAVGYTVNLVASAAIFAAGDVGNRYIIRAGGKEFTVEVTAYTDTTHVVTACVEGEGADVSAWVGAGATTDWDKAVDNVSGLGHLEGETITMLCDGAIQTATVAAGVAAVSPPAALICAGLPYDCDLETLDLDVDGTGVRDKKKRIGHLSMLVEKTRGIKAGPDSDNLDAYRIDDPNGDTLALQDGLIQMPVTATWNDTGRVFVRGTAGLPATIAGIIPVVEIGG